MGSGIQESVQYNTYTHRWAPFMKVYNTVHTRIDGHRHMKVYNTVHTRIDGHQYMKVYNTYTHRWTPVQESVQYIHAEMCTDSGKCTRDAIIENQERFLKEVSLLGAACI